LQDKNGLMDRCQLLEVYLGRPDTDTAVITYQYDCDMVDRAGNVVVRLRNNRLSDTWARRYGPWVLVFSQMTQVP